ncbi:MAG: diadenylate cyclase CdaA [Vampirovibrionales bacterium]|nr:diadenylate cyclase CdaA [Vampirovibrionales bacterium]
MPLQIIYNWPDLLLWLPQLNFKDLGQLFLLFLALGWAFQRFVKGSQAEPILRGVFVLLVGLVTLSSIAWLFNLPVLQFVFMASIFILLIGMIVIFQPELRRTLLVLGQGDIFQSHEHHHGQNPELKKPEYLIQELCEAVHFLSKSKRGALIVLEANRHPNHDYLEVGTALDAQLSTELLLTIFHPNTPLHDGAVIISPENRIKAAGVLLPLTENPELSWQYGTRHRAAIGLTEVSDSRCLVVSEETGYISLVEAGKLTKLESIEELKTTFERIYRVSLSEAKKPSDELGRKISGFFGVGELQSKIQSIFRSGHTPPKATAAAEKKAARNG